MADCVVAHGLALARADRRGRAVAAAAVGRSREDGLPNVEEADRARHREGRQPDWRP